MTTRILRKRERNPTKFDALSVFAAWAQQHNTPITAPDAVAQFANFLAASLKESIASDTMLYGNRTQMMFEAVVANLGEVQLVKGEDTGNIYSHEEGLEIPDTRIVLANGSQILVETKNHHESSDKPYRIKKSYLDGLSKYAELVGCKLRVAIFWSRMRRWTLVAPSVFKPYGKRMEVDFLTLLRQG